MKTIKFIVTLLALLLICKSLYSGSLPTVYNHHAVELSIGSIGVNFDTTTYRQLRRLIGNGIADNTLDKFVIYGYGIEGGFSGCVEDRSTNTTPTAAFEKFVRKLKTIHPKAGSFFSYKLIKTCFVLPISKKPATVQVAKSDNSISCDLSSGISVTEMRKELGVINVYSAKKLDDGLIRAAVCGIQTGKYNVYEISSTNLVQAKSAGFVEWSAIAMSPKLGLASQSVIQPLWTTKCTSTVCINGYRWKSFNGEMFCRPCPP